MDDDLLDEIRTVVRALKADPSDLQSALALSERLGNDTGVTIDFDDDAALVIVRPSDRADPFAVLSTREREVAALVAEGLKNREVAQRLFISEATVKDHLHSIYRKLDVRNRAGLAARARRR